MRRVTQHNEPPLVAVASLNFAQETACLVAPGCLSCGSSSCVHSSRCVVVAANNEVSYIQSVLCRVST